MLDPLETDHERKAPEPRGQIVGRRSDLEAQPFGCVSLRDRDAGLGRIDGHDIVAAGGKHPSRGPVPAPQLENPPRRRRLC